MDRENTSVEDILRTIQDVSEPKPQIKIGEHAIDFDPTRVEDIQRSFDQEIQARERREQELRMQLEQTQRRFATPTEAQPVPQFNAPMAPVPQKQKTPDELAALQALDGLLGDLIGVPGMGGAQALKTLAGLVQVSLLQGQNVQKEMQGFKSEYLDTKKANEVDAFVTSNPDYEDTDENSAVIEDYLKRLRLAPSRQNLELAFLKASHDGAIRGGNRQQPTQNQSYPTGPQRMPSIGRNQNARGGDADLGLALANFRELPLEEMQKVLSRFEQ
jgi:hypothetical protein